MTAKILRCKKTFFAQVNGRQRMVRTGELLLADDPAVAVAGEKFFEVVDERLAEKANPKPAPVVERASADPGERRSLGRPRKVEAEPAKVEPAKAENVVKPAPFKGEGSK